MTVHKKGFTLIELLIVMAVLGVLAALVLIALNPAQQLARARDTGRKSAVTQIGNSMLAYGVAHAQTYVPLSTTFISSLSVAGEIDTVPKAIGYATGGTVCAGTNKENNICYLGTPANGQVMIYTRMESRSENSRCAATEDAFWAFHSSWGRSGMVCTADGVEPTISSTFID